jgi:hypothetical protein
METTIRKKSVRKSKKSDCLALVIIEFLKDNQPFRMFDFITQTENLRLIREFCKNKNKKYRNKVHEFLVDEPEHFNVLFSKTDLSDLSHLFSSEFTDLFQEYSNIVQHYLCCFEGVLSFIEQNSAAVFTFLISVDLSDESKTQVLGNFTTKGGKDQDIDYQLN